MSFANKLTKEYLKEKYQNQKLTSIQIAKEIGCSPANVTYFIRKHGISVRKQGKEPCDLSNNRFGKLTVLSRIGKKNPKSNYTYECKCDCGNVVYISGNNLGKQKTCGCWLRRRKYIFKKVDNGKYISSQYFYSLQINAAKRKIEFNISIKELDDLLQNQNFLCALSGRFLGKEVKTKDINNIASLDRIDSSKGYLINNIQWIHKDINQMKNAFDNNYFIQTCKEISEFNQ